MSELPEVRASDAERERAVDRLRDGAAEGRLSLEEFTERMHSAYDARTRAELETLVGDLPEEQPDSAPEPASPLPPAPRRSASRWIISLMGNTTRRGRWRIAEHAFALTAMGNSTIDLRNAELSAPEVTITVFTHMGNTRVIVPRGVDVDLSAVALMGTRFDHTTGQSQPGAPLVRINGLVLMGNLFVQHR